MKTKNMSARVAKLRAIAAIDNSAFSREEKQRIASNELELVDRTITLKTEYGTGEMEDLVSNTKNTTPRRGINDFKNGELAQVADGGSVIVDAIKIGHATGLTGDDAASKLYTQTTMPATLAHAVLEFRQGTKLVGSVNLSEFLFSGDEPNTRADQWLALSRPWTFAAGKPTTITLKRPENVTGVIGFISIELKGMQTFPKRA